MSVVICFPHIYSTVIIVPAGINRNCVGRIEEVVPEHQPPKLNVCTLLSNPSLRRILGFFSRFYFTSIVYMHTQIRTHICIYIMYCILRFLWFSMRLSASMTVFVHIQPLIVYCAHSLIICMVIFSNKGMLEVYKKPNSRSLNCIHQLFKRLQDLHHHLELKNHHLGKTPPKTTSQKIPAVT